MSNWLCGMGLSRVGSIVTLLLTGFLEDLREHEFWWSKAVRGQLGG